MLYEHLMRQNKCFKIKKQKQEYDTIILALTALSNISF